MNQYLGMTRLSRENEEKLLAMPAQQLMDLFNARLSKFGGRVHKLVGADTHYTFVQKVAKVYDDAEVARMAIEEGRREAPAPRPIETPKPVAAKAPAAAKRSSGTVLTARLTEGKTKIMPGSLRAQVADALRAAGGSATIADLDAALGFASLPVLRKLAEVQWVELA